MIDTSSIWWEIFKLLLIPIMVTIAVKVINKTMDKKETARDEARAQAFEKSRADVQAVLREEIAPISQKLDVVCEGTLCSLRNDILNCYYRCKEKGFKTTDDAKNFRDLVEAYHDLDGNSFIDDDIIPAFDKLELKENQY